MQRETLESYPALKGGAVTWIGLLFLACAASCAGEALGVAPAPGVAPSGTERPLVAVPGDPGATPPLAPFELEAYEVTNAAFERFVQATGYVTEAEAIGNAAVFLYTGDGGRDGGWTLLDGADWRHPEGPDSSIESRAEHPVVHVSWADAAAYAAWAGLRLPTEREWQHAARGGRAEAVFPWPDDPGVGELPANVWQGAFPAQNEGRDGWLGTAPVGSFAPNGYGLFDMGGNVWEWAGEPDPVSAATVHGGSYLCARDAAPGFAPCEGYRCGTRQIKPLDDANNNVGFRCAR